MGSDGLWDELNKDDIAQIVKENGNDKNKLAEKLIFKKKKKIIIIF